MKTLTELSKDTVDYLKLNQGLSEYDMSINDISRETISAMKEEFKTCFLGKINLYGEERTKEYKLVEYTGQLVYNFEYTFCIPVHDSELEKMINERDKAKYTGTKSDRERIEEITNRIILLKGQHLLWS